jgi:hypothetical protein
MAEAERQDEAVLPERIPAIPSGTTQPSRDRARARTVLSRSARGGAGIRLDPTAALSLQRLAGNRATARFIADGARSAGRRASRMLQRLGYPLAAPIPSGGPTPLLDEPDHREWKKTDFHAFWEEEQGRKLSDSEKSTIDRGCIGITANNLEGGSNPSLTEVYDDFARAQAAVVKHNSTWWNTYVSSTKYVVFGMLFWSNQDPDPTVRKKPNPSAFRGDPTTRKVDMSGYKYLRQPGE